MARIRTDRRRLSAAPLALAVALAAAPALAHEKGDRAMGLVESVTPERLVVKTSDGHSVAIAVTPETRFLRGDKAARREDVRVGERTVVQVRRAGESLEAVRVKLAAKPPPR